MLSYKIFFIFICIAVVSGFAIGRYSNRGTDKTIDTTQDRRVAADTKKITVVLTAPDGKKTTTETTEVDTHVATEVKKTVDVQVKPKQPITNLSALAGFSNSSAYPLYGASVTRELVGPFTVGAFGAFNRKEAIGMVSIGVNF